MLCANKDKDRNNIYEGKSSPLIDDCVQKFLQKT